MFEPVAKNDLADVVGIAFIVEFGRVNADHHEFLGKLRFEPLEIGDDVNAVDAAVRPEVEDDDLAAQLLEGQRPVGVEPIESGRELGSGCRFRRTTWPVVSVVAPVGAVVTGPSGRGGIGLEQAARTTRPSMNNGSTNPVRLTIPTACQVPGNSAPAFATFTNRQ